MTIRQAKILERPGKTRDLASLNTGELTSMHRVEVATSEGDRLIS